jgi:hypothetical protein
MARPLRKTAVTSLKMTPEVRDLWEQCAQAEDRSLTNLFEVLVRAHAKKLGLQPRPAPQPNVKETAPARTRQTRPSTREKKQ